MNYNGILSFFMSGLIVNTVYASSMGANLLNHDWQWVGTISGGAAWTNAGESQTFNLTPRIKKAYVANKIDSTLAQGELFAGIQKPFGVEWKGQLGLAGALTGNTQLEGIIWDGANPEAANYSYHYKIRHSHLAVKGKLLKELGFWLTPWVSGSLGVSFNRSYDYNNTPLIFEARTTPNFSNHTQTAFTYNLGAGVQKVLTNHWQIGVGYEFADWGKSELGRAYKQTLNTGLKLSHLYTHGVLLNLTYIV